jgi:hypothetical protein
LVEKKQRGENINNMIKDFMIERKEVEIRISQRISMASEKAVEFICETISKEGKSIPNVNVYVSIKGAGIVEPEFICTNDEGVGFTTYFPTKENAIFDINFLPWKRRKKEWKDQKESIYLA